MPKKTSLKKILDYQANQACGALLAAQDLLRKAGDRLIRDDHSGFEELMQEALTQMSMSRWLAARNSGIRIAITGTPENKEITELTLVKKL